MDEKPPPEPDIKPTKETYERFQHAYDVLNRELFDGTLPNCLITLQRRKSTYGYFCGDRFAREDGKPADEIALNPAYFRNRPVAEILATLAHEMVHLWQHHFGKPGRGRYHNKQWAARMREVGLVPTDTGAEGGNDTGDRVSHFILAEGVFDRAARKLLARGFVITWTEPPAVHTSDAGESDEQGGQNGRQKKSGKRVRYTCGRCELNAWAKHDARLMCGDHQEMMEPAADLAVRNS